MCHATARGGCSLLLGTCAPRSRGLHCTRRRGLRNFGSDLTKARREGGAGCFICGKRGRSAPLLRNNSPKPPTPSKSICRRNFHSGSLLPGGRRPKRIPINSPSSSAIWNQGLIGSVAKLPIRTVNDLKSYLSIDDADSSLCDRPGTQRLLCQKQERLMKSPCCSLTWEVRAPARGHSAHRNVRLPADARTSSFAIPIGGSLRTWQVRAPACGHLCPQERPTTR